MRKKLTNEYVRFVVKKEGYTLITPYVGSHKKIKLLCPNNHTIEMWWGDFNSHNHRCKRCYHERTKHSIEDVKEFSIKNNLECLENIYINSGVLMKFKCLNNHIFYRCWSDIQRRPQCPECWKLSRFGESHPAWKGGISCEPYCEQWLDKEYKESIKDRDAYKCLNPECSKMTDNLCIHHIDYNKKNCPPKNLITICRSCNSKANTNRDWHESWYSAIIYRRYYG